MLHEMTITVDDTVYETLRPFVEKQTIGELLRDFARSRSAAPAYTQAELEAGYRAMASDEEYEREAQEWINGLIGDIDDDDDAR
jgi:ribosomal protein L12E/L44/L45/RPP1/RPP2